MKSVITFLFALLLSHSGNVAHSQIPNNGFEDWETVGNCMKPLGWYGTNDLSDTLSNYFGVTRSTDHYPPEAGSYSVRIQNNVDMLPDWSAFGIIWSGGPEGSDNPVFPVGGHPGSFCVYYKYFPQNNDTMRIFISLYNHGEEVTQTMFETSAEDTNWVALTMLFADYTEADSARILISSFYPEGTLMPQGNSVLYVDNMSFDNLITDAASPTGETIKTKLYPNPVSDQLTMVLPQTDCGVATLDVFNMMGEGILTKKVEASSVPITIDVARFPAGEYLLRIQNCDQLKFHKRFIVVK